MKRWAKIVVSIFVLIFTTISLAQPVLTSAYTFADSMSSQDAQIGISNYLKGYNDTSIKETMTTECALYNLKTLVRLGTWIEALDQLKDKEKAGEDVYSFPSKVTDYEKEVLISKIQKFNEIFGNGDTDSLISVKVCENADSSSFSYGTLLADTKSYLTKIMDKLLEGESDVDAIAKSNKKLLRYIYYVTTGPTSVAEDFNGLMPYTTTSDSTDRSLSFEYSPVNTLFSLTTDSTYADLILKGRELALSDNSSLVDSTPDESAELLDLFLNDVQESGDSVTFSGISQTWYLYFACGSIYQPFTSVLGDDRFMDVLNKVSGNTAVDDNSFEEVYNRATKYKKPLYFMTLADDEVKGNAEVATLAQLIEYTEDLENKALVLPKGKMTAGKDDNSYYYAQANTETDTASLDNANPVDNLTKSNVTKPILKLGKNYLDSITLQNIFCSIGNLDQYKPKTASLYMTVFGDIVLEDGTVILPGSANATLYAKDKAYSPYTIAFLQNYPNTSNSNTFSTDKSNIDKRIIMTDFVGLGDANDIYEGKINVFSQTNTIVPEWTRIKSKQGIKSGTGFPNISGLYLDLMTYDFDDAESTFAIKNYGYDAENVMKYLSNAVTSFTNWFTSSVMITKNIKDLGSNNVLYLFENDISDTSTDDLAKIVRNYFTMIYTDETGKESEDPSPRFSSNTIGKYVIGEVLNGLTSVQGYEQFRDTSYEQLVADESNRLKVKIVGVLKDFIQPLYDVSGVIGLQNAYQSPILGTVVSYAKIFLAFILLCLCIALIFKFVSGVHDLFQTVVMTSIAVLIGYVFVNILPVYLPVAFNGGVNIVTFDESSDLGYMSLLMHMEDYEKTYATSGDSTDSNTSSINLYKFNDDELDEICDNYKLDKGKLLSGELAVFDDEAGIYIEGNILKCSLDDLFINNPITGSYVTSSSGKYYTLKSQKMLSSCIDYYTPYHLIVDALVERLNTFSQVYRPRREFINYGSIVKDSFMMRSYLISPAFLDPDNTDLIGQEFDLETQDLSESLLGTSEDVFNLSKVFSNPTDEIKNSLWFSTLEQNGKLTEDNVNAMVGKATLNTKRFLIDNYDKLQYISDENIIKITALYITTSISRNGGTLYNELYPMFVNSEEFTLSDILLGSYVSDREQFRYKDLEIITYVSDNYGLIWSVLFCISVFVSWCLLTLTEYIIPILYLALGLLLIMKYIFKQEKKYVIKGYIRGTILIFLVYLIHCLTIVLVSKLNGSVFSILLPVIININGLEMVIRYILSVITKDPLNLGGKTSLSSIAPWIANKLGITAAMASINKSVRLGSRGASSAFRQGKDSYANYRDYNAYDTYYGQDSTIGEIMNAQRNQQANREYHIDKVTSPTNRYNVKRTKKTKRNKDTFKDYRE